MKIVFGGFFLKGRENASLRLCRRFVLNKTTRFRTRRERWLVVVVWTKKRNATLLILQSVSLCFKVFFSGGKKKKTKDSFFFIFF